MVKKLCLLMAGVAVLAFAIPAMANAAPEVTSSAGKTAAVGTNITGTNSGHVLLTGTPFGTFTCKTVTLNGQLTVNTGTKVTGNSGTGTCSGSELPSGWPLTITHITVTHLESTVVGSGKASFTFVADLPEGFVCDYTGTNVPFTYVSGSSHITFSNAAGITAGGFCGGPNMRFDGTFKIEIGSTAVILD